MTWLQIQRELLSLATFLRVHYNPKEVSYLSWQNTYPNLKTSCHIKLKCFMGTKLTENLLLAKYLTSVAASLINVVREHFITQAGKKSKPALTNFVGPGKSGGRELTYRTQGWGPRKTNTPQASKLKIKVTTWWWNRHLALEHSLQ